MTRDVTALFDGDGIFFDFHAAAIEVVRKIRGDVPEACHAAEGVFDELTAGQREACWKATHEEGWIYNLPLYEGAQKGITAVRMIADRVVCVTSPLKSKTWQYEREKALRDFLGFDRKEVHVCPSKDLVYGDLLVEDRVVPLNNWAAFQQRTHRVHPLLWDRPYNQHHRELVHVVRSWDDVCAAVRLIAASRG